MSKLLFFFLNVIVHVSVPQAFQLCCHVRVNKDMEKWKRLISSESHVA